MSVPFGVDLEAGPESAELSKLGGAGTPGDDTECQPGTGNSEGDFGDISEKMWDLNPPRSEKHVDVVLERWKGNTESILLSAGLLSATISLFVIESRNTSSPDVAVALFNQLISLDQPPPSTPLLLDAVLPGHSSSVVRPTILWLLSLCLNITCTAWVSWQQWRQQFSDLLGQSDEPARLHPYLTPGVGPRFCNDHITVEANRVLLHASMILFFVGLVDFLFQINKTITWILLGYLTPFTFLYAAATLLPCHSSISLNPTLFPYWT